ncbi:hypothetical protein altidsur_54 [Escherichia phage altidsur]|uniref:Uncharacterized protein n=1 Tax=Escherichia phage altidsur TaxID=2696381 RepID=A0A6B9WMP8_9CAUD|nr:hypothetical protein altidsur_54 [Escherichia phage altidsur]
MDSSRRPLSTAFHTRRLALGKVRATVGDTDTVSLYTSAVAIGGAADTFEVNQFATGNKHTLLVYPSSINAIHADTHVTGLINKEFPVAIHFVVGSGCCTVVFTDAFLHELRQNAYRVRGNVTLLVEELNVQRAIWHKRVGRLEAFWCLGLVKCGDSATDTVGGYVSRQAEHRLNSLASRCDKHRAGAECGFTNAQDTVGQLRRCECFHTILRHVRVLEDYSLQLLAVRGRHLRHFLRGSNVTRCDACLEQVLLSI